MRRYAAILLLLAGCDLYFGGSGDDAPPCKDIYPDYPDAGAAFEGRDPETGICSTFGGGGWNGCGDSCGPCAATEGGTVDVALAPLPDWGACYSSCNELDEQTCLASSGCFATYLEDGSLQDAPSILAYNGCFATPPSGPVQGGGCYGLGAQECSRHDDCSLLYDANNSNFQGYDFTRCAPEPTAEGCNLVDCGPGSHCEDQCYACDGQDGPCPAVCTPVCVPDSNACAATDCAPGYDCVEVCDAMDPTNPMSGGGLVPGHCYGQCVPSGGGGGNPGSCTGEIACDALPPACPANTTAGRENGCWTGYCIPNTACGPNDPGSCTGTAICATPPPACPAGTVAGLGNGCWTGFCIPADSCPQASCEALTTENACANRADCTSVYSGGDCTCTPNGCTCNDLTFARCETWGTVMPF
ncbi:MAG: hypothetical protein JWP01_407 [Myxococcales bacterium]|nr:hypothetical protein [Myxococcales bacterium]